MRGRVSADVNGGRHAGTCQGGFFISANRRWHPDSSHGNQAQTRAHYDKFHPACDPPKVSPILDMCHSELLSRAPGRERRGANGFLKESFITGLGEGARADTTHQCSIACLTLLPFIAPFLLRLSYHLSSRHLAGGKNTTHTHKHTHAFGLCSLSSLGMICHLIN